MTKQGERFPLQLHDPNDQGCPDSVPYAMVQAQVTRAWRNHGQSVARLKERGGLSPQELWCVLNDKPWRERATQSIAIEYIKQIAYLESI